jgi:hypothetical protein
MRTGEPSQASRCVRLAVLLCFPLAGACFQTLDQNASSDPAGATPTAGQSLTSWQLCQSPSCDSPSGEVPVLLDTPPIYLPDGGTTSNPCDDVELRSMTIRQTYCASCHEAPASQAGLGFILDDAQLSTALSQTAVLPDGGPQRLLVPGSPYGSRLYQRVAAGLSGSAAGMPPVAQPGYPAIPRPSAADLSLLYGWIVACIPGTDGGGYVTGGAYYAPTGADSGGPSAGTGSDAAPE